MPVVAAIVALGAAAALLVGLSVRRGAASGADGDNSTPPSDDDTGDGEGGEVSNSPIPMGTGRVQNRERAAGVHPRLQQLLDLWEVSGWFDVQIAGGTYGSISYVGGLRTNAAGQAATAGAGLSKASTLMSTPHGRGAALDVWPVGFDPTKPFSAQPTMQSLMQAFGEFAENNGFVWGGRWSNFKPAGAEVAGDWPHVELPNWLTLPFPANYA